MKTGLLKMVLVVVVLALATLACSMSVPGVTTDPVVTQPVTDPGNGGTSPAGKVLISDDFAGHDSNWGTGTDADSAVEYVNDALLMNVFTTKYFVYSGPDTETYQNVHIEVTAQNTSTDPLAAFGIMCDQQVTDVAYYYAYITPSGDYGIVKAAVAKDDEDLVTGSSDLIPQNAASYRIGMDCGNGMLTLYVNGQKIDSVSDSSYVKGGVDLFAWSDEVSSGTNVAFDDFLMTSLP
jgi:hypothetical protein